MDSQDKRSKRKKAGAKKWLLIIIVLVVIIPFLVNIMLYLPIPTLKSIQASDWLGFWGGYLGSLIGTIAALLALYDSREQAEQQQFESKEDRRYSVMPALSLSFEKWNGEVTKSILVLLNGIEVCKEMGASEYSKHCEKHNLDMRQRERIVLRITNYGLGPAFQTEITWNGKIVLKIDGIKEGSIYSYGFDASLSGVSDSTNYKLKICFSDILGNIYMQFQQIIVYPSGYCESFPAEHPRHEQK